MNTSRLFGKKTTTHSIVISLREHARGFEVHAVCAVSEVPSPVEAVLVGERYQLTNRAFAAAQRRNGAERVPGGEKDEGRAPGMVGQVLAAALEARHEAAGPG